MYTRRPALQGDAFVDVALTFSNGAPEAIESIAVGKLFLEGTTVLHAFPSVARLAPGGKVDVNMAVDFADTLRPVSFEIT
jgi:hypothetical protein